MGRSPCCVKEGMNRGAWTAMEDKILIEYIKAHGEGRWRNLPKRAGLKRCGKSCRLRWLNYLRPDIKRGNITPDEEELILRLHKLLGNRWSLIAGRLPGRTDNEIKNYWNTNLSKRLNATNDQVINHNPKKSQNDSTKKRKKSSIMDTPKPSKVQAIESNVVRTKAVRCTKAFINPQPQPQTQPQLQPQPVYTNNITLNDNHNYSWTRLEEEYNKMSSDFMMENNVNMGDFKLISELLTTDLMDICDFGNESMSGGSDFSSNSEDDPFIFSQELLEDWLGDNQLI